MEYIEKEIAGKKMRIETGKVARQVPGYKPLGPAMFHHYAKPDVFVDQINQHNGARDGDASNPLLSITIFGQLTYGENGSPAQIEQVEHCSTHFRKKVLSWDEFLKLKNLNFYCKN